MKDISRWMDSIIMELSEEKAETLLVTVQIQRETDTLMVEVMLDARLNFKDYNKAANPKATLINGALSRIMPNIGRPRQIR